MRGEVVTFGHDGACSEQYYTFSYKPRTQRIHTAGITIFSLDESVRAVTARPVYLVRIPSGNPVSLDSPTTSAPPVSTGTSLPSNTLASEATPRNPGTGKPSHDRSHPDRIGIAVGASVFFILVVSLVITAIMRHRRRNRNPLPQHTSAGKRRPSYHGKPELEGTTPSFDPKPELDAMAVRAELEGSPGEETGDGINVPKPELEGSAAQQARPGEKIYVRRKNELEGTRISQLPSVSPGIHDLEGVRWT
ncbi:hypothetical protein F5Y17DRAFT_441935 [Xylariaceae sp. FL0594]|nr:hypothetical protein F5Y17DRAFT_441935 [Xylariaceae sp. FL0594]